MNNHVPTTFYRLDTQCFQEMLEDSQATITLPDGLESKLRKGNGLVLADWNEDIYTGQAKYIGLVESVNQSEKIATVSYAKVNIPLEPSPSGRQFWRKEFFCFATAVVERYRLKNLFSKKFKHAQA